MNTKSSKNNEVLNAVELLADVLTVDINVDVIPLSGISLSPSTLSGRGFIEGVLEAAEVCESEVSSPLETLGMFLLDKIALQYYGVSLASIIKKLS